MGFLRSLKGARRGAALIMALVAVAAIGAGVAGQASAGNAGQLGNAWGTPGNTDGKLTAPSMIAAEESGSVFITDRPAGVGTGPFRLQKFSSTGTFEGAVTIATPNEEVFKAIAVDSDAHLLYLLREKPGGDPVTSKAMAETIVIYSTIPNPTSHLLEPPATGPTTLTVPTDEAHVVDNPTDMVLDTHNHELEIAGENRAEQFDAQRIATANGAVGPHYAETSGSSGLNEVTEAFGSNGALAITPDGTSYVIYFSTEEGANAAVTLSETLTNPTRLTGFAEGTEHIAVERNREGIRDGSGAQAAFSPDGSTLYIKPVLSRGNPTEGANMVVFAYSLADGKAFAVYGGKKSAGDCTIQNVNAGLAPVGEGLFVLDQGNEEAVSPWGVKVTHFGPGGSGCPAPSAADAIKVGSTVVTEAHKGSPVTLDASPSELGEWGESIESVFWKVEGPESFEETVPSTATNPLTLQHTFNQEGSYKVRMSIQVKKKAGTTKLLPFEAKAKPLTITAPATVPAPVITELSPTHGTASGGNTVTIKGTEFTGATSVKFGVNAATGVVVVSAGEITAKAPAGTAGSTVDVSVTTSEGGPSSTTNADRYTYDIPTQTLSVAKAGSGSGTVASTPAGINCGTVCSFVFEQGKEIALAATPASGSTFTGWGGACTGTGSCRVTMSAAKSVTATFDAATVTEPPKEEKPPVVTPPVITPPVVTPPKAKTPAEKLAEKRKAALKKCTKLKGKAKATCVKKANAIGKKKPAKKHASRPGG